MNQTTEDKAIAHRVYPNSNVMHAMRAADRSDGRAMNVRTMEREIKRRAGR